LDEASLADRRSLTLLDSLSIPKLGFILIATAATFVALVTVGAMNVPTPRVSTELASQFPLGAHAKDSERHSGILEKELHFNWQLSQQFDLVLQLEHNLAYKSSTVTEAESIMVVMKAELSGLDEDGTAVSLGGAKTFTRHVQCSAEAALCEPIVLIEEAVLRYKSYKVSIQMLSDATELQLLSVASSKGLLEPKAGNDLARGTFLLIHKSMKYVQFQLVVKYTAVGFTCIMFLYFLYSTRSLGAHEYNVETKWLPFLHAGLLCFNDPLFGIAFVLHTWYVTFISELLQTAFWAILLLFWLSALDSMASEARQRSFEVLHLPKLVWAFLFWGTLSFSHGWVAWHHMQSPYYSEDEELSVESIRDDAGVGVYGLVEYALFGTVAAYVVWATVLALRAIVTLQKMDQRLRLLCLFTCGMMVATLAAFFNFWVLHKDSSHESTDPMRFVTFTSLFNVYIGLLTFLCTPAEGTVKLK